MRAAILYGKEEIRVEELKLRPLAPGEVRIDIRAALTCGTDLKVFRRGYHAKMIVPPAVFGHELSGVIAEVHPETVGWKVGDRVVTANSAPCGGCLHCQNGQESLCDDLLFLNGAYAESIIVPDRIVAKNLLRLRDTTDFPNAALTEPLACVVLGIESLELRPGQSVLVLGSGPIGLMFAALLKDAGCTVTLAGRGKERLQAAVQLGVDHVLDLPREIDTAVAVRDQTKRVFDVVVEAVGKPEAWESAIQLVRKGGRVNLFGGCPANTKVSISTSLLHYSGLTLLATFHHTPRTVRRALHLLEEGIVQTKDFVDGTSPLSQLPDLFRGMSLGNRAVKTLIDVRN